MKRLLAIALGSALLAGAAPAAENHALLSLFEQWGARAMEALALPDAPAPSRVTMSALAHHEILVTTEFGAVSSQSDRRFRPAKVEVVVGDDGVDSSRWSQSRRFGGQGGGHNLDLVVEDSAIAIERDLWMATDASYKSALPRLQQKQASLVARGGETPPPDWSAAPPLRRIQPGTGKAPSLDALTARAAAASGALRGVPGVEVGVASARATEGEYVLASTEGQALVQPEGYAVLHLSARTTLDDGVVLSDERQWVARGIEGLPAANALGQAARSLGASLAARAGAAATDYYEGPVVFEGEAAAQLLAALLPPQIQGTPPEPSERQSWKQQRRSGPRIGRQVLPAGWTVVDDPGAARASEAGGFAVDREGVVATAVTAVEDGYVRRLLMSRVPRKEQPVSNGHARGLPSGHFFARTSVWSAMPSRLSSLRAFERAVAKAQKGAAAEQVLVVRRLALGREGDPGAPTEAVWRAADGSESAARNLAFQGLDRRSLRDIAAAAGTQRHAYLAPRNPGGSNATIVGLPSVLQAPERLLVLGLELVDPGAGGKPHVLGPPPQ